MDAFSESLENKINRKIAKIGIIGLGQVGLPTALTFSKSGFNTIGHDINSNLLKSLMQGKSPFEEHGLEKLLTECLENKRFFIEESLSETLKKSDIIIICVATPITSEIQPNLTSLESVCSSISELELKGKLVLIESSIPPYTFEELVAPLMLKKHTIGNNFWLAFVPERLSPGDAITGIQSTPRIIGTTDNESGHLAKSLYKNIVNAEILIVPVRVAEISKLVENTFRDVNVALANEIGLICEKYGVDFTEVRKASNSHPRVNLLDSGPGVGGPCLPKDPYLLLNPRGHAPIQSNLITHARKTNDQISFHVIDLIEKALTDVNKNFSNSSILVLGVTYKANVSDTRYSPASKIIPNLIEKGVKILVHDPFSKETFGGISIPNIWDSISECDLILILTDHLEFKNLDLEKISQKMNNPLIVDCRRIFNKTKAEKLGINYFGVGLGK